ncbi:CoA transferase, partial [Stutzerimonas stutzeri]|nr:CoA transferase [Stutzerimonas stutzeri]
DAPQHPHLRQRGVYQELDGMMQAAPAPRFSRTPGKARRTLRCSTNEGWD